MSARRGKRSLWLLEPDRNAGSLQPLAQSGARRRPDRARGFTLLELLVAMTIVGLGVVTLMQIFSLGLRLEARSTSGTEAVAQGARLMDEMLARKNLAEGSDGGPLENSGRWKSRIQALRDASASLDLSNPWELKEIALEMSIVEGERERRIALRTLRLTKRNN